MNDFFSTALTSNPDTSHNDLVALLERGEVDAFIEHFLDGLEDQCRQQRENGGETCTGEVTRSRARTHLLRFWSEAGRFDRMRRTDTVIGSLKNALSFTIPALDEATLEARARKELAAVKKAFMDVLDDEAEATRLALDYLSGTLKPGSGQGGMHPRDFADIVDRAAWTQQLKRFVLSIGPSMDGYHLEMTVLATDEEAAEQLTKVARKIHERRAEGKPN